MSVCAKKASVGTWLVRQRSQLSRSGVLEVPSAYFIQFDVELHEVVSELPTVLSQKHLCWPTAAPDQPLQCRLHDFLWHAGSLGEALTLGRVQWLPFRGQSVDSDALQHGHGQAQGRR